MIQCSTSPEAIVLRPLIELIFNVQARETWKPNKKLKIKRKEKSGLAVQVKTWFLQFLPLAKFLLIFIFNHLPYFSTFSIWSLVQKRASNWPTIGLQTLSILQLCPCKLGQKTFLLAAGIPTFTLDIQTRISRDSDIKIKRFKSSNLSTRLGLQL